MIKDEIIIQTGDVKVRVMTLLPGEATVRHHHTEVTDFMVGLEGSIQVLLFSPDETVDLAPGERCRVKPGRSHKVLNTDSVLPASYLLIQGVGQYDFMVD